MRASQGTEALSSAEAEFYALVEGASKGHGVKSLMEDLGWQVELVLKTDSSAAKGMAKRQGIGKVRHVETKYLWIQRAVRQGRIQIRKVRGDENPADVGTKYLSAAQIMEALKPFGIVLEQRQNHALAR